MRSLLHTAFSVGFVSVFGLLFIEWKIPGFVSYVFPFYWLILVLVAVGIAASIVPNERLGKRSVMVSYVIAALVGISLMSVIWEGGEVFGFMRIPLAITLLIFPLVLVWCIKSAQ